MKNQKINAPIFVNHKMNWFQQFLLICSGANLHILRKTPSEWNKFSGIGGIVLFTAIFATLSAGYAIFTVFDDLWISVGFAILWGLMIFNLDTILNFIYLICSKIFCKLNHFIENVCID